MEVGVILESMLRLNLLARRICLCQKQIPGKKVFTVKVKKIDAGE
jgi:hypothetical protein